ncbi:MAG: hypothetical protein IT304_00050 [Dehalococcoidia bacterium]|nr:hypothetical protein [Dehalococcoidia bacterium]
MLFPQMHPFVFFMGLLLEIACVVTLASVASARGQSKWYALWGVLGLFGLAVGLLLMLALPAHPGSRPPVEPAA